MSSPLLHPVQQKAQVVDWARLIPGETQLFRAGGKKPRRAGSSRLGGKSGGD